MCKEGKTNLGRKKIFNKEKWMHKSKNTMEKYKKHKLHKHKFTKKDIYKSANT